MDLLFAVIGLIFIARGIFLLVTVNEENVFKYFKRLANLDTTTALNKSRNSIILMLVSGILFILVYILKR